MADDLNSHAAPNKPTLVVDQGMGCLEWSLVYIGAMLAGALALCTYVTYLICNDADQGSPGGMLVLLAIVSVIGACGGLILAGLGHLLHRITRRRPDVKHEL